MSAPAPTPRVIRFDTFDLDLRAGELRKHGVKLRLQGQPLQVLAILLESAGNPVTREELRNQLWPADTFVDFDHSLHNAIARIREALADSAETPRYIETLPRRGYRFIAQVERVRPETPLASSENGKETSEKVAVTSQTKPRVALAFTIFALAAAGSAFWLVRTGLHATIAAPRIRSIAVLPLQNLSGDPSQEYFTDGMTDELITDLAKINALRVISRTSVMRYKRTKKSLPEIARELNVDGIVEGSVMRSGNRVRITAQLLQASTDQHLWAETYDRDLGDVLRLQSQVAQAIAQQVRAELTPQQEAQFRAARPLNLDANEPYLRGRYYLSNQFTMATSLKTAKSDFEESIRKDPSFAPAYSGLADSYVWLAFSGQGGLSPDRAYKSAKEALNKALALDDSIGEAYDTLGLLSWRFDWDWDAAERHFNQAIALAPSYSCAHEDRAVFLSFLGRRAEALAEIANSNAIDPGPSSAMAESASHYQMRDYEGLLEASRRGVASNPNEWTGHYNLAVAYAGTGKLLEAVYEYQKAVEMSGGNPDAAAALAHVYAVIGRKPQAEKILHDLEQKSKNTLVSPYTFATIYASLGNKDKAFQLLERAYREKSLDISWHLKADLRIDNLRSDPRFQDLVRRVGYPE